MHAVGLVTEYNPFHNGHVYHLQQAKRLTGADVVVVTMSGNFTQRGEPTILDKWQRTNEALANGADLVVELPVFMAVQPAHRFAQGAVELLADLGVQELVFGAEHPDWNFDQLVAAGEKFSQDGFSAYNATYATQFNQALSKSTGKSLTAPNDILAFAYYKAIHDQNRQIKPVAIERLGSQYHDETIHGSIASASAIRKALMEQHSIGDTVPQRTAADLQQLKNVPDWSQIYPLLRNILIQTPPNQLAKLYQMAEGLEYRMKRAAEQALTFDDFIHLVKTKRYTYAHLLRQSFYTVMLLTEEEVQEHVNSPYIHILGFTKQGQRYLHSIKKQVQLPLITKVGQSERDELLNLDYRAGKLYQLFTPIEQDLKHAPIRQEL